MFANACPLLLHFNRKLAGFNVLGSNASSFKDMAPPSSDIEYDGEDVCCQLAFFGLSPSRR